MRKTSASNRAIAALAPTSAQTAAARALCNLCPNAAGTASTTAADCIQNFFAVPFRGLGQVVIGFNDEIATAMMTCANRSDAGVPDCYHAAFDCVFGVLGTTPSTCAAPDPGTND